MKIAITGTSGRVGSAVVKMALAQGHHVVGIDRVPPPADASHPNLIFIQADVTQYEPVEQALAGCDALIHLAAIPAPGQHPDHEVHNTNVLGSYNALQAAAQLGIRRICQASSVNATGAVYSRQPRYDYLPLDEMHPTYAEDPYSLSKWICEQQADAIARRHEELTIASLRLHGVVPDRAAAVWTGSEPHPLGAKQLWGYTRFDSTARACLLSLEATYRGHEVFYIVAPDTVMDEPSLQLASEYYPNVPIRGDLSGRRGFYNCAKAERLLGWRHDEA
jgi:nucleoside-diphosphate-sugar epimerase